MKKALSEIFSTNNLLFYLFIVIAFALAWSTAGAIQRNYTLQQDADRLAEEVSLLELENENLKLGIEYYKTDEFLELEARQRFNKVVAGETVLVLPEVASAQNEADETDEPKELPEPQYQQNWNRWMDFLFGSQGG